MHSEGLGQGVKVKPDIALQLLNSLLMLGPNRDK